MTDNQRVRSVAPGEWPLTGRGGRAESLRTWADALTLRVQRWC